MLTREMFNKPYLEFFSDEVEKRLQECIEFVNTKRPDLEKNFTQQFFKAHWQTTDTLHPTKTRIMWDFAPLSFYFEKVVWDNGKYVRDYNGGIIFHGNHDGGGNGGAPTFSVNIMPVDGWAMHT